jgi:hypothetical protein
MIGTDCIGIYKSNYHDGPWQYNGEKKTDEKTNNDPQNTAQKTKDWGAAGCCGYPAYPPGVGPYA